MPAEAKICGLTRAQDAAAAVRGGASYLGVIYASGPRRVTDAQAREVVQAAGAVPVLGVFGTQTVDDILRARDATGIRGAQLHNGDVELAGDAAARLRGEGLFVWRVRRIAGPADIDRIAEVERHADAVLVEPRTIGADGGAGVPLDLDLARAARARLAGRRMVLAGGLTADTVAETLALVQPEVVDVSSGVEFLPGIKDLDRMRRFLEAVLGTHAPF